MPQKIAQTIPLPSQNTNGPSLSKEIPYDSYSGDSLAATSTFTVYLISLHSLNFLQTELNYNTGNTDSSIEMHPDLLRNSLIELV